MIKLTTTAGDLYINPAHIVTIETVNVSLGGISNASKATVITTVLGGTHRVKETPGQIVNKIK